MRISIAMATYNGAKYLQEQLDSFLYQIQLPDELVVCDDGSTDSTVEILEAFRQQAPFAVRIFRNETNLGYIKNFEKGLSFCSGDIIFLSDQDDVWFCTKIAVMAAILASRPDVLVLQADMVLADANMTPSAHTQLGNIRRLGYSPDTFLLGCSMAIRKTFLDLVLPIPSAVTAHDNWIYGLSRALGARALHKKPLQYYRRHGSNASNSLTSRPTRITSLDALRQNGLRDATHGWRKELEWVRATWLRLDESTLKLGELGLAGQQAPATAALLRHMEDLGDRILNVSMPRFRRLPRVFALWFRGGYSHFAGWKSMVKDIVRP